MTGRRGATLVAAALLAGCAGTNVEGTAHSVASAAPALFQDGLIHAELRAKIAAVDVGAETGIGIAVHAGHVTLTGAVRTPQEREKIVAGARGVKGVTSVDDELRVNPAERGTFDGAGDLALTARVAAALAAQTGVNAVRVRPSVRRGVVTLSGSVPSQAIKETMLAAARRTGGVRAVVDRLTVKR